MYYDPYDVDIDADPYPVFRRLREEAPLYYNEAHDFYARQPVRRCRAWPLDNKTFISGRGGIIELIRAGHRDAVRRAHLRGPAGPHHPPAPDVPGVLAESGGRLEPQIREFCVRSLDPLVGAEEFDFIADLGAQMPMRVIGMLLGIPEQDQEAVRDRVDANLRTEAGQPMEVGETFVPTDMFGDYIDWRVEHPSDDIMTELLQAEFEDETGSLRRLTREELLTYISVITGAGNETTGRLIGWTGKVLADHPDQRRELVEDPSLIPGAIEELLRFETPHPTWPATSPRTSNSTARPCPRAASMMLLPARPTMTTVASPTGTPSTSTGARQAPDLRLRDPPVPGRGPGPPRGPGSPRGGAQAVPHVGGRHGPGQARPHLDRPGLGDAPGVHLVSTSTDEVTGAPGAPDPPVRSGRPYDGTLRRERAAETREKIIDAGSELIHRTSVRDWKKLTVRAVAVRAGVNERTVYRHFGSERGLRDAVMHRNEQEAGIELDGMHLADIATVAAQILDHVAQYPKSRARRSIRPWWRPRTDNTRRCSPPCDRRWRVAGRATGGGGGSARRPLERRHLRTPGCRMGHRPLAGGPGDRLGHRTGEDAIRYGRGPK